MEIKDQIKRKTDPGCLKYKRELDGGVNNLTGIEAKNQ